VLAFAPACRIYLHLSARGRVFRDVSRVPECRIALVLGTRVEPDGKLSPYLRDRVDAAIALYRSGKVDKLLMSGDNRVSHYNEPRRMAQHAIAHGVPSRDVGMDFAGRRTWDSVYRARHIFRARRLVVVSQGFHLDRALFICRRLGVDAWGFAGKLGSSPRVEIRETLAAPTAVIDAFVRRPRPVMGERRGL